jgi:SSS family solute:Na+ symporter
MGVLFAGFVKLLMPLLVVVPGIIAFRLFPGLPDKDTAFPTLVRELVPVGLSGIVMAGLASGLLSHVSSVLNASSTVFTMDLYKPLLGREKPDQHLVRMGRISAFVILAIATLLAIWFSHKQLGVFLLIQEIGAWVAAPISAVFLLGVLWRRTTAAAATFVLIFAFPYTWFLGGYLFKHVAWFAPLDNWMNLTTTVWATCVLLLVSISLFTKAPDPERIRGMIWSWNVARMPESERERNRGVRNLFLWWAIFIGMMLAVYLYMAWFQFFGPAASIKP